MADETKIGGTQITEDNWHAIKCAFLLTQYICSIIQYGCANRRK